MNDQHIRVMIVDDHQVVRNGLKAFFTTLPSMEIVAEAENGTEAVNLCAETQPDVILMDVVMPQMDGIEATYQIHQRYPHIRIIGLSCFEEAEKVHAMLNAGASGYILKHTAVHNLEPIIRTACAGQLVLSKEITQVLLQTPENAHKLDYHLSKRELEVLGMMADGLTNRQIAEKLSLSPFTIKAYVSDLLSKLGVSRRSEAVALALKNNLLD